MYPRWLTEPLETANLREVAPGLYVGDDRSPSWRPQGTGRFNIPFWHTVIDFYGRGRGPGTNALRYLALPFEDGQPFPRGALDAAWDAWQIADIEHGNTLIHCQMGLSRSASAAYALLRKRYGLSNGEALARVVTPLTAHQYPMKRTLASATEWVRTGR